MLYSYLSREGKCMRRAKTVRRISGNMLVLWRRISKMMMVDQVQEQKTDGDLYLHGNH